MPKSKCSLAYHELENGLINDFSTGVKNGVKANPTKFPTPPVDDTALGLLIGKFTDTYDLWKDGGIDQRGAFLDAKTDLMEALDETAVYVDQQANGNETTIIAGGFKATKTTREPKPEPKIPTGTKGKATGNGKIEAECDRMDNADFYGAVCSTSATSLNNIFQNGQFNFSNLADFLFWLITIKTA